MGIDMAWAATGTVRDGLVDGAALRHPGDDPEQDGLEVPRAA
jgi:hypothetical protein